MNDEDFRDLYTSLRGPVFSFARRRVGADAAHDVLAETFEVAWRKRDEFPEDRAAWAAWVVGIAKNKVLQALQQRTRKHHDHRFVEDWVRPHGDPTSTDTGALVAETDAGIRVYHALTPAEKLLFDVAFFRELSAAHAAEVLGITESAFTTRVSRLRQRIRVLQQDESDGSSPANIRGEVKS